MVKQFKVNQSLDLFAGGGGLSLASQNAGFRSKAIFEVDKHACEVMRNNFTSQDNDLEIFSGDIRSHNLKKDLRHLEGVELIVGGPPCQPFSIGGKKNGFEDPRDMFPSAIKFVNYFSPKAFVFENVPGLVSPKFSDYLNKLQKKLKSAGDGYDIHLKVLNAADYGVPQYRKRLFIVGLKRSLNAQWRWPIVTHSLESLFWDKYVSKEYFRRYDLQSKLPTKEVTNLLVKAEEFRLALRPYVTIRDVICDLPHPLESHSINQHFFIPGAKIYKGHTGSDIDSVSKAIKAGVNGCPGGENIVRFGNSVRYLTVRELARIQTFPDSYVLHGSRSQCIKRLGNAVPVLLGTMLLSQVSSYLRPVQTKQSSLGMQV